MLAGIERVDGHLGVQMERQGDDDHLDFVVFEQLFIVLIEANAVVGAAAIVEVEALARADRLTREDAGLVAGPDVAVGDELDVSGVVLADEDAPFVAGADEARLDGLGREAAVAVAVVGGSRERHRGAGSDQALHEASARDPAGLGAVSKLADDALEILLADRLLFRGHIESHFRTSLDLM